MKKPVVFYSEGVRLAGDVYYPDGLSPGKKRAGIVLCHGYTGIKDLYLPDNASALRPCHHRARGRASGVGLARVMTQATARRASRGAPHPPG